MHLDSLAAQIGWKIDAGHIELKFGNLSFANRDLAGTLSGSFATKESSRGLIDLTGHFTRVDGPAVYRYIPRLPPHVVDYLKLAIQGGHSNDVRLRLKGNLSSFPFEDPKAGTFQVVAKVTDAKVRYAQTWPEASDISGDLIFEGRGMRVVASKATVLDVRATQVRVAIPDLFNKNEQLHLEAQSEDQTEDFLRLVEQSPVTRMIDGFTEGMRATGPGRLQLKLDLPIRHLDQVKVAGVYQFLNNQLRVDAEAPPFTQMSGRLEFTEGGIVARGISGQFLGGATTIGVATRPDGSILANAQGVASTAAMPRAWGGALLRHASGSTAWSGSLSASKRRPVTLIVESQLTGVAVNLPAPLGKSAAEAVALRVERIVGAEGEGANLAARRGDIIKVSFGPAVNGWFQRRRDGDKLVIERGVVSFNEPALLPERAGFAVTGSLAYLDIDRWRALLAGDADAGAALAPTSLNLKLGALDFAGRRLNDLVLRAGTSAGAWNANVAARELVGDITWRPEGLGRVVARLKSFTVPDSAPGATDAGAPARDDLPALDIVADNFVVRERNLGKLEFVAVNVARGWRIEKVVISNPESTLSADGVWQNWATRPSISVNMKLDINDAGKYLERMGYSHTMQRGTARLEGKIGWAGNPQSVDYPTLTGNLTLTADKGQFLKAEPGVARLLGILSLQSWATLDFREMFGEGFAFETLSATASISKGMLTTKDFRMKGATAQVSMSGDIDLAHETQNLRFRVVPSLGDSVASVAGLLLANPIAGLGAMLAQRIFKDPLGQIFAFDYAVTGTWSEPKTERVKVEARSPEAAQQ